MKIVMALGATFAISLAAVVAAYAEPADTPLYLPLDASATNPDWLEQPSAEDMSREFPPLAQLMGLGGRAKIACTAEPDGRVDDCTVIAESPTGLGFGAAAIRAAAYMKMRPGTHDGEAVKASVVVPLNFEPYVQQTMADEALPRASPAALALARRVLAASGLEQKVRDALDTQIGQATAGETALGDAKPSTVALAAAHQAADDTTGYVIDRMARAMAAQMSETQLKIAADFFESGADKAWIASTGAFTNADLRGQLTARFALAARTHFCAAADCGPTGTPVAH